MIRFIRKSSSRKGVPIYGLRNPPLSVYIYVPQTDFPSLSGAFKMIKIWKFAKRASLQGYWEECFLSASPPLRKDCHIAWFIFKTNFWNSHSWILSKKLRNPSFLPLTYLLGNPAAEMSKPGRFVQWILLLFSPVHPKRRKRTRACSSRHWCRTEKNKGKGRRYPIKDIICSAFPLVDATWAGRINSFGCNFRILVFFKSWLSMTSLLFWYFISGQWPSPGYLRPIQNANNLLEKSSRLINASLDNKRKKTRKTARKNRKGINSSTTTYNGQPATNQVSYLHFLRKMASAELA